MWRFYFCRNNKRGLWINSFFNSCAIIILLFSSPYALAQERTGDMAVLDIRAGTKLSEEVKLELLTNVVREVAVKATRYRVMTRENVYVILTDKGIDPKKCVDVVCEVEFGRVLQADKLVVGELSFVASIYYLSLSLYDTPTAAIDKQLSRECPGCTFNDLMGLVRTVSGELFGAGRMKGGVEREIGVKPERWEIKGVEEEIVRFESEPQGAIVEIGDKPVCETPCASLLYPGPYRVAMKKPRYFPYERDVVVRKEMEPVSVRLEPDFGWLTVRSEPSGLDVFINEKPAGKTPIQGMEVSLGAYEVVVRDARYYEAGKRVEIERGEREEVAVHLQPREGGIKVRAFDEKGNALEGEVYVDGSKIGRAPGTFKVIIGEHEVEVREKSGGRWSRRVTVPERNVVPVDARLSEKEYKAYLGRRVNFSITPNGFIALEGGAGANINFKYHFLKGFWIGGIFGYHRIEEGPVDGTITIGTAAIGKASVPISGDLVSFALDVEYRVSLLDRRHILSIGNSWIDVFARTGGSYINGTLRGKGTFSFLGSSFTGTGEKSYDSYGLSINGGIRIFCLELSVGYIWFPQEPIEVPVQFDSVIPVKFKFNYSPSQFIINLGLRFVF